MSLSNLNRAIFPRFIISFILITVISGCADSEIPSYTTSSLYIFGDSLSDSGNVTIASAGLLPDNNYYKGRFSNGPNYADQLASKLNTPLKPSRSFGSNYAFGGAKSLDVNAQVSNYKSNVDNIAKPEAIYIIWTGGNDLLDILLNEDTTNTLESAVAHIEDAIRKLVSIGATKIVVPNQVNMGHLPRILELENSAPGIINQATTLTINFNTALDNMLDELATNGVILATKFDTFTLFENVVVNPIDYELSNITDRCYIKDETLIELTGEEIICNNSDDYLFWDSLHPTHSGHTIIVNQMFPVLQTL